MKRILIQGAEASELCYYTEYLGDMSTRFRKINEFDFWIFNKNDKRIILSYTGMGMTNAALATMTAIQEFQPDVIINQGTAGAQVKELKRGDIVIGSQAVNIHSLKMEKRGYGEGMAPERWRGMLSQYLDADETLLQMFQNGIGTKTASGRVVTGILGSGDLFSKEKDRILWLHREFGNLSEDMESFAVYAACKACSVPCLGIRVISNNELLDEEYDPDTALELQRVIWDVL